MKFISSIAAIVLCSISLFSQESSTHTSTDPLTGESTSATTVNEPAFLEHSVSITGVSQGSNSFASVSNGNNYLGNGTASFTLRPSASLEINVSPMWMFGNMPGEGAGIAGNPNALYSFSNPTPFLGTAYAKYSFEVMQANEENEATNASFTLGKIIAPAMIEASEFAGDPTSQFLNISALGLGAWELPQEARGTTWGASFNVQAQSWSITLLGAMLPNVAGGLDFDENVTNAYSFTTQFAFSYSQTGRARLLGFVNHDNSLNFAQANSILTQNPEASDAIEESRSYQTKIGAGIELEDHLSDNIGAFARASWNDGKTESYTFTQINSSLAAGLDLSGNLWGYENHHMGIQFINNNLSKQHQTFHELGGSGFMVSGENFAYAAENIAEIYYNVQVLDELSVSLDYQLINNVGYNANNGTAHLYTTRFTVGF